MTPAEIDMEALIAWAFKRTPSPCQDGIERARRGWAHLAPGDRHWIAERCGPELHELLACDPNWTVRAAIARRCGPKLLQVLALDANWLVRAAVAARCGPEMLAVFARDPHSTVREAVAEHCDDIELLRALATDLDEGVRQIARDRLEDLK